LTQALFCRQSLYTSIPVEDAINNTSEILHRKNFTYFSLTSSEMEVLLRIILTNTYFTFYGKIYQQTKGLAMGSSVSAILAILFLDTLERQALTSCNLITGYNRYVDDVFFLTRDENTANEFLTHMNTQHPSIKFELELPRHGNQLSLLDFEVNVSPGDPLKFQYYKKPAKKDIFMNYKSAVPTQQKVHIIRNEHKRIIERCSDEGIRKKHSKAFQDLLQKNKYPRPFINHCLNNQRRHNRRK
jgi:hypothetical protein